MGGRLSATGRPRNRSGVAVGSQSRHRARPREKGRPVGRDILSARLFRQSVGGFRRKAFRNMAGAVLLAAACRDRAGRSRPGVARGASGSASQCGGSSAQDRKSDVEGKSVSVLVDLGGRRLIKKKK